MRIIKIKQNDTVTFTDFTHETNIIYSLLACYFHQNKINYIAHAHSISISDWDYDRLNEKLIDEINQLIK